MSSETPVKIVNRDPTGAKEKVFITAVFVYHLVITSAAPLSRMYLKYWTATGPVITKDGVKLEFMEAYPTLEAGSAEDKAFGLHALCAIMWMVFGYIQMVWTPRFRTKSRLLHKIFGYVSLCVYLCHCMGALNIWSTDHEQHSFLNRCCLFMAFLGPFIMVFEGMKPALIARLNGTSMKAKKFFDHRYIMCQAWIFSLNGAGTIRTIAIIESNLNYGSVMCQVKYGTIGAGGCDWTYTWRMMFAHGFTLIQRAMYIKIKRSHFDSEFLKEVYEFVAICSVMFGCMIFGLTQTETLIMTVLFKLFWAASEMINKYGDIIYKKWQSIGNGLESKASNVSMMLLTDIHANAYGSDVKVCPFHKKNE